VKRVEIGLSSTMGLTIKDDEVERLVNQVVSQVGVSKIEAICQAMQDKAQLLGIPELKKGPAKFSAFLEDKWQKCPAVLEYKVTKAEYDAIDE
jgi:hypothetical protein